MLHHLLFGLVYMSTLTPLEFRCDKNVPMTIMALHLLCFYSNANKALIELRAVCSGCLDYRL